MQESQLKYHMDSVFKLALSPEDKNFLVSGGGDDVVVVWNLNNTAEPVHIITEHKDTVDQICFNHDGKLLATGGMDGLIYIWDTKTQKKKCVLEGPAAEISFLQFHHKGNAIVAGAADNSIWLWNGVNGEFAGNFPGHNQAITCGGFTPDGKYIVSGSEDATVRVWNPKSCECIHNIKGHGFHEGPINTLVFSEKSGIMATGSVDRTVCLSSYLSGKALGRTDDQGESIESIIFPKNFDIFCSGSLDGGVRIFDVNKLSLRETFKFESGITKLDFNNDKNLIYASTVEGFIYLFDHRKNAPALKISGNKSCIHDFLRYEDDYIISAGDDGRILKFDIRKIPKEFPENYTEPKEENTEEKI
mmetsp:Transcript_4784/g.3979  ORF Transcript_4784/g.3979 Transcript_4784/m.3979 type:complete len:360 (+) Transcript_4784:424-1503(+)